MILTLEQVAFAETLLPVDDGVFWACHEDDRDIANALVSAGIVEIDGTPLPDGQAFRARLTQKGIREIEEAS